MPRSLRAVALGALSLVAWTSASCGRVGYDAVELDPTVLQNRRFQSDPSGWVRTFGGSGLDAARDVAFASDGSLFVTGTFESGFDFGGGPVGGAGRDDVVVARYARDGSFLWARAFGGAGVDQSFRLAVDASDNVYVCGTIRGQVDFGGGLAGVAGDPLPFVVSYGPNGEYRWVWTATAGSGTAYDVAVHPAGGLVLTGDAHVAIDFGEGIMSIPNYEIFLVRLDASGRQVWWWVQTDDLDNHGRGVGVAPDGTIWLTGMAAGSLDFGAGPLPFAGGSDVLTASFTDIGAHRWSALRGHAGFDRGHDLAVLPSGEVYFGGVFIDSINFGTDPIGSFVGGAEGYLARVDAAGGQRLLIGVQSDGDIDQVFAVDADDATENVFVAGRVDGDTQFGDRVWPGQAHDAFVASFHAGGAYRWARVFGGAGEDEALGVAADVDGSVAVVGRFSGEADLGHGRMGAGSTGTDGFIRFIVAP